MATRPTNHVTRALQEKLIAGLPEDQPYPDIDEALVQRLEADYPHRCYTPRDEALEDHLLYAGEVRLVQRLRGMLEDQRKVEADDPDE